MTKEEIKNKLQPGDFTTLGAMLGCQGEAARKRFNRDDKGAIEGAIKIIETRESLIEESQKQSKS
ncbi:hypothetical protein [Flavobacterium sp. N1994]|uniref:hypothetical protein n=1 Tax=Flavobacterium sp. N1994 TaxID=2986827 RepID=UPI00222226FE|nr:hypothetical protein [Flavobacterium sp. N1994]